SEPGHLGVALPFDEQPGHGMLRAREDRTQLGIGTRHAHHTARAAPSPAQRVYRQIRHAGQLERKLTRAAMRERCFLRERVRGHHEWNGNTRRTAVEPHALQTLGHGERDRRRRQAEVDSYGLLALTSEGASEHLRFPLGKRAPRLSVGRPKLEEQIAPLLTM